MRSRHRRVCRNSGRASGKSRSTGERRSNTGADAVIAANAERQSIEPKYCASSERNTGLAKHAGYGSRRALSVAPRLAVEDLATD
jgi:hypothetical protein